jgi:hypothetical protein
MSNPDVSVILPTIRVHLLDAWLTSLEKSCSHHTFEVICCGPFEPSAELLAMPNFKWIRSYASPTVCAQLALLETRGDKVLHSVDDIIYFPDVVSDELDRATDTTITAMRYREGENHTGHLLPDSYWYAGGSYNLPGIDPSWGICVHFLMPTDMLVYYGGFDSSYSYLNHSTHDLLFRIFKDSPEIKYQLSLKEISSASWFEGTTKDHAPIHYAQTQHDEPLFRKNWVSGNVKSVINIMNYMNQPEVWDRRFTGKEEKYDDLSQG